MNKNLTRDDISDFINSEFGLTKKDCNNLVNDIIEELIVGLNNDKVVKIHNFGTFKIKSKKPRIGRNPKSKVSVTIPARNVISFIPSKHILKKINKLNNE